MEPNKSYPVYITTVPSSVSDEKHTAKKRKSSSSEEEISTKKKQCTNKAQKLSQEKMYSGEETLTSKKAYLQTSKKAYLQNIKNISKTAVEEFKNERPEEAKKTSNEELDSGQTNVKINEKNRRLTKQPRYTNINDYRNQNVYLTEVKDIHDEPRLSEDNPLTCEFKNKKDLLVAREIAIRANVFSILRKGIINRTECLMIASENSLGEKNKRICKLELAVHQKFSNALNLVPFGKTWAASGSYRKILAKKNSIDEANKNFPPVCINLRSHEVLDENDTRLSSLNRSGALSDYSYGHTNLSELELYLNFLESKENEYENKTFGYLKNRADGVKPGFKISMFQEECISIENILKPYLADLCLQTNISDYLYLLETSKVKEILEKVFVERRASLQNQFLCTLVLHFERVNKDKGLQNYLKDLNTIVLARLSLLDTEKEQKTTTNGFFIINERNQVKDMHAIYAFFNDKTVIFDGTGPYIDTNDGIHVPFNIEENNEFISKKIECLFTNISIQGSIDNTNVQKEINSTACQILKNKIENYSFFSLESKKDYYKLHEKILNAEKIDIKEAIKLIYWFNLISALIDVSCFSGKDRTGYILAEITSGILRKKINSSKNEKKTNEKKTMDNFNKQLLGEEGIASKVVKENTGCSSLKLSNWTLDLAKNSLARAHMLFNVGVEMATTATSGSRADIDPEAL